MRLGKGKFGDDFGSSVRRGAPPLEGRARFGGHWAAVARNSKGEVLWTEEWDNLVVDEGLDHILDVGISGGSGTAIWYVGLTDAAPLSEVAGDTMASHSGWVEVTAYTGSRKAYVDAGVTSQSCTNTASKASFAINGSTTVGGAFLNAAATGTAGILYAVGAFTGGDKVLGSGDTLDVTAVFTSAAA